MATIKACNINLNNNDVRQTVKIFVVQYDYNN